MKQNNKKTLALNVKLQKVLTPIVEQIIKEDNYMEIHKLRRALQDAWDCLERLGDEPDILSLKTNIENFMDARGL